MNTEDSEFERIEREQAMPGVPDAIHHTDTSESLEYITGWNDCRAAMLEHPALLANDLRGVDVKTVERFAELVRADAISEERAACLAIADDCADSDMHSSMAANFIRARSNTRLA